MANDGLSFRKDIADIIIDALELYTRCHVQTFAVMFTITYPTDFSYNNKAIQVFMDRFTKHLEWKGLDPFYLWVREQSTSHNPHYHCLVLLNGSKIQNRYGIMEEAKRLWGHIVACNPGGLVDYSWEPWRIRRNAPNFAETLSDCIFAASYLAKTNTKGSAPNRERDFGYSHLHRFRAASYQEVYHENPRQRKLLQIP